MSKGAFAWPCVSDLLCMPPPPPPFSLSTFPQPASWLDTTICIFDSPHEHMSHGMYIFSVSKPQGLMKQINHAFPPGCLTNSEDMEVIAYGTSHLRLSSRSAASSASGSTNTSAVLSAPRQSRGSEERRRAGGKAVQENLDATGRGAGGRGQAVPRVTGRWRAGRGSIPPPIETRLMAGLSDEAGLVSAATWVQEHCFFISCCLLPLGCLYL